MEYDVKSLVIGLDLGGTNSVFGIVDGDGEIIATTSIKTQTFQCVEQYVEESVKAVMQIVEQVDGMEKIRAMGIGAPCGNYYKGTIENAANLAWSTVRLHYHVSQLTGKTVATINQLPVSHDTRSYACS